MNNQDIEPLLEKPISKLTLDELNICLGYFQAELKNCELSLNLNVFAKRLEIEMKIRFLKERIEQIKGS